jgi:hypothetical protein
MRPELTHQLDAMPAKERKELLRNYSRPLLEELSSRLPAGESILGIATAFLSDTGQNGVLAYTQRKLIFGSWMNSSWRSWLWEDIERVHSKRPFSGPMELYVTTGGNSMRFSFGLNKGESKDWVEPMCSEISNLAGGSQLSR